MTEQVNYNSLLRHPLSFFFFFFSRMSTHFFFTSSSPSSFLAHLHQLSLSSSSPRHLFILVYSFSITLERKGGENKKMTRIGKMFSRGFVLEVLEHELQEHFLWQGIFWQTSCSFLSLSSCASWDHFIPTETTKWRKEHNSRFVLLTCSVLLHIQIVSREEEKDNNNEWSLLTSFLMSLLTNVNQE